MKHTIIITGGAGFIGSHIGIAFGCPVDFYLNSDRIAMRYG